MTVTMMVKVIDMIIMVTLSVAAFASCGAISPSSAPSPMPLLCILRMDYVQSTRLTLSRGLGARKRHPPRFGGRRRHPPRFGGRRLPQLPGPGPLLLRLPQLPGRWRLRRHPPRFGGRRLPQLPGPAESSVQSPGFLLAYPRFLVACR